MQYLDIHLMRHKEVGRKCGSSFHWTFDAQHVTSRVDLKMREAVDDLVI